MTTPTCYATRPEPTSFSYYPIRLFVHIKKTLPSRLSVEKGVQIYIILIVIIFFFLLKILTIKLTYQRSGLLIKPAEIRSVALAPITGNMLASGWYLWAP